MDLEDLVETKGSDPEDTVSAYGTDLPSLCRLCNFGFEPRRSEYLVSGSGSSRFMVSTAVYSVVVAAIHK